MRAAAAFSPLAALAASPEPEVKPPIQSPLRRVPSPSRRFYAGVVNSAPATRSPTAPPTLDPDPSGRRLRHRVAGCSWPTAAVLALTALHAFALSAASLLQHATYNTNAYDLSWFDQLAWNAAHGRLFRTSFIPYSFLGNHFEPVVLPLGCLYRLWASPAALLLLQAFAVSLAAVPLYLAARRLLCSPVAGACVAAAYLLAPQLHRAELFDFHPELLGPLFLCAAFAALSARRAGVAVLLVSPVCLLKEDAWLIALGMAGLCWLLHARAAAAVMVIMALIYLVVVAGVLMPHFRGSYPGEVWRYSYLGTRLRDYPQTALGHPGWVWGHLSQPIQLRHLLGLLGSQAALPLASPAVLAALPVTGANLLSTYGPQSVLDYQYAVAPTVLWLFAAVLGVRQLAARPRLGRRLGCRRAAGLLQPTTLAACLLLAEAAAYLLSSPLGLSFDAALYRRMPHTTVVAHALAMIPPHVPVSAQTGLLPHLSERQEIHDFPDLGEATYVVVDRFGRRSSQSIEAGYDGALAALPAHGFCLRFAEDGVQVYQRCNAGR